MRFPLRGYKRLRGGRRYSKINALVPSGLRRIMAHARRFAVAGGWHVQPPFTQRQMHDYIHLIARRACIVNTPYLEWLCGRIGGPCPSRDVGGTGGCYGGCEKNGRGEWRHRG